MAPQAYGTPDKRPPGGSRASSSWRAGFVFVLPSVLLIGLRVRAGLAPAPAAEMRERSVVSTRRNSAIGFTLRTAGYAEVSRHTLRSYGDRWDHIVEPHNPTVLAADVDEEDGVEFLWRVRKVASLGGAAVRVPLDEVVFESTGREVHFAFTEVNVMYAVRLEVASDGTDDGASASSPRVLEKKVRVARVSRVHARRVTRSLPLRSVSCASTSAERSDSSPRNTGTAFWTLSRRARRAAPRVLSQSSAQLTARAQVIYTISDEVGRKRYGQDFRSHKYFGALHNSIDYCFHGNLAFLTAHPAFSLELDRSLRAVDPTVGSQPYWDFMQDHELGIQVRRAPRGSRAAVGGADVNRSRSPPSSVVVVAHLQRDVVRHCRQRWPR